MYTYRTKPVLLGSSVGASSKKDVWLVGLLCAVEGVLQKAVYETSSLPGRDEYFAHSKLLAMSISVILLMPHLTEFDSHKTIVLIYFLTSIHKLFVLSPPYSFFSYKFLSLLNLTTTNSKNVPPQNDPLGLRLLQRHRSRYLPNISPFISQRRMAGRRMSARRLERANAGKREV